MADFDKSSLEELKQNNLIEDGKVSLDSVYKEEEEARKKLKSYFPLLPSKSKILKN